MSPGASDPKSMELPRYCASRFSPARRQPSQEQQAPAVSSRGREGQLEVLQAAHNSNCPLSKQFRTNPSPVHAAGGSEHVPSTHLWRCMGCCSRHLQGSQAREGGHQASAGAIACMMLPQPASRSRADAHPATYSGCCWCSGPSLSHLSRRRRSCPSLHRGEAVGERLGWAGQRRRAGAMWGWRSEHACCVTWSRPASGREAVDNPNL